MCLSRFADNTIHQHHAVQIIIGLEQAFALHHDEAWHTHRTAIIAPDIPHQLISPASSVLLVLLDQETEIARQLSGKFLKGSNLHLLDAILAPHEFVESLPKKAIASCIECRIIFEDLMDRLLGADKEKAPAIDDRIQKALKMIQRLPVKKISTSEIAAHVCLSESRLLHLFKEQVGIPVRRYLLWRRLNEAVKQILNDMSLTDAAHEVGFSDSAHLSRTFRSMFGVTISDILKNKQFIDIIACMD